MSPEAGDSPARRVLDLVLDGIKAGHAADEFRVLASWIESESTFCLVFTSEFTPPDRAPVGLRRRVDDGWTAEEVATWVLESELGEPLGSLAEGLELRDSVWWFEGDRKEWKVEPLRRAVRHSPAMWHSLSRWRRVWFASNVVLFIGGVVFVLLGLGRLILTESRDDVFLPLLIGTVAIGNALQMMRLIRRKNCGTQ